MSSLMERIGNERRRLRGVRQRMAAALEAKANGDENFVPFYIAAADYIDVTMQRLHEQDVKMGKMVLEKVDKVDDKVEEMMEELDRRLEGAKAHLKPFLAARDELRQKGSEALERFESAAQEYSDFIAANMGHQGSTNDIAGKLFTPADWEYMAGVTDEQQIEEQALYNQVCESMPANVEEPADLEKPVELN